MKIIILFYVKSFYGFFRHIKAGFSNETAHLHKLGDKAVALCRIPQLSLFVFNLPNCELLRQITLMEHLPRPLEPDDLDQRFLMKDNTMIFMFHDSEFFSDLLNQDSNNHDLLNQQGMDCSSITDENLYIKFMIFLFSSRSCWQ